MAHKYCFTATYGILQVPGKSFIEVICWWSVLLFQSHSNLGPGQYEIKSFLDDFHTEHKKRAGRFGKVEQYQDKPTERIYCVTLSQNPREPVSHLELYVHYWLILNMKI